MCGIFGMLGTKIGKEYILNNMSLLLEHRGPDDSGFYADEKVYLGHRRLSIIDLESGKQPIHNEDKSLWVILNGEIYNYQELRDVLLKKGHQFYTQSDTEVLIHMYEEKGIDFVEELNGMFAFALWDSKKQQLFLVRDQIGIKPLYYYWDEENTYFASEIKALVQSGAVNPELNEDSMRKFFFYRYIPGSDTFFKKVSKLLPGDILILTNNGGKTIKNFRKAPDYELMDCSDEECIIQLRSKIKSAVKYEMIADVPIGTFLSGGVDSSAVTSLAEINTDKQVNSYSVEFDTSDSFIKSEVKFAKLLSERFYVKNYSLQIKEKEVIERLPLIAWHYDEPMGDAATIPTFFVSELAKKEVKVVLAGEGGDEQFAGYTKYEKMLNLMNSNSVEGLENVPQELARRYMKEICVFLPEQMNQLFLHFDSNSFENQIVNTLKEPFEGITPQNALNKMLEFDQKTMLCENYLMKGDKMTMAHGLEERVPLLNRQVFNFSRRLRPDLKLRNGNEKFILKQTMKWLLPDEIINRKKQGYGTPTKNWFEGELGRAFEKRIGVSQAFRRYFNKEYIHELYHNHISGKENNNTKLWCLLAFDLWYDIYILNKDKKPSLSYYNYFGIA